MTEPAATTGDTLKAKLPSKPNGWLGNIFSRKAPWWIRIGRSAAIAVAGLLTVDNAVLPNMPGRRLSSGEETMLREVFHDSIDYNKVRIHQSGFADAWLGMMGQTAVARGNVIFVESTPDKGDYSQSTDTYMQYALTHEAAHIWQEQNGVMPNVFFSVAHNLGHMLSGDKHVDYRYSVLEGKDLLQYSVEQQASIITEGHFSKTGQMPPLFNTDESATDAQLKSGYDATLRNFYTNPAYPRK